MEHCSIAVTSKVSEHEGLSYQSNTRSVNLIYRNCSEKTLIGDANGRSFTLLGITRRDEFLRNLFHGRYGTNCMHTCQFQILLPS